jgi:cytochrome c oxidase subunit 1
MTTTTAPVTGVGAASHSEGGLWSWITTVDHKRIGALYGVTAFIFFLIGGLEALLIRIQLMSPGNTFVSPDVYNQLFTMHGTTMIFLAIMPLSASFFNFLVPLMIGARDVAFPRLNAFSYWVYLFGAVFLNLSFFMGGAPDVGWFGYSNLTSKQFSPGVGVDYWAVGLQILGIASLAAGFNFIVTIVNMRAPGLGFMRMPVFVWMTLVTSFLIIFAFPVITVALVFLLFDRMTGTNFFVPLAGGDPVLWQHLFWLFGHPEVYILILPAMGIVSEILPTFSKKPLFGYPVIVYSGIFIGFMGWGVWSHHMFAVGLGPVADSFFALTTMLIAIPTGVKIFNWIATMWGGRVDLKSPMLFAIGFIALFIMGGLSGIMHASPPADLQQTDTYFVVAHIHYVLFGGSIMGIFAGIYYWFPKMTGRMLDERLGSLHFWVTMIAMNVTFFPMHFVGLLGMPRRVYTYPTDMGFDQMNLWATIGALALGAAQLIFIVNVLKSRTGGKPAGPDPWGGPTLEWAIPSPPPVYNFATVPTTHHRDPLWEEGAAEVVRTANERRGHIHMPPNSYWPFLGALGMTLLLAGMVYGWWVGIPGLLIMLVSFYAWAFEPAH